MISIADFLQANGPIPILVEDYYYFCLNKCICCLFSLSMKECQMDGMRRPHMCANMCVSNAVHWHYLCDQLLIRPQLSPSCLSQHPLTVTRGV